MSFYGDYIKERENFEILEFDYGFVTYQISADHIYLRDLYIEKSSRNLYLATKLCDHIVEIGKKSNCKYIMTSVCPEANNSTVGMLAILSYGFKLLRSKENMIYFIKEI